ncbi:28S ribosomal mitochondrial [Brachionus plicatilis]|uniref:28S ribosomal mitochondrial n=1 Tax=Brachionus plicatilis TaxID=10195 RepID=A0A3M7R718_BRAPC|nr:28S ribosomal mitochondrial [Brachionus plicatilis]
MFQSGLCGILRSAAHSAFRTCSSMINIQVNRPALSTLASNSGLKQSQLLKNPMISNHSLLKQTDLNQSIQVRHNWGYKGRMMLKDIKRRELLKKYAPVRIRLQTLRANTILPKAFRKAAEEQLQKLTRHSTISFINNRCQFTSKAASCLNRWRLSRHVWRDLADYNQMSGVTRAVWGTPTRNAVHFTFKKARRNWFNYDGNRDISFIDRNGQTHKYRFKLN